MDNSKTYKCRLSSCGKAIDPAKDEYVSPKKGWYYHPECYKKVQEKEAVIKAEKDCLTKFRNIWYERINSNVEWWQLNRMIRTMLDSGVSADRMLYTLIYIVEHKFKLNYPGGFKYYLDNVEIAKAYEDKRKRELAAVANKRMKESQSTVEIKNNAQVQFKVPKRKTIDDIFN